jgi:hypothetical protein
LLLHEVDSSVLFLEPLVAALRANGWSIISAEDAYTDPLYKEAPEHLYSGAALVAQVAAQRTGKIHSFGDFDELRAQLHKILGL